MTSIEEWAVAARKDKYHQDAWGPHQRAINTLQGLLEGNGDPDSAAITIASLYEPWLMKAPKTSPVATLWGLFCSAARALGGNRETSERLVRTLDSIADLPDVTDEQGKDITPSWSSAGVYWRDLPEFAMMSGNIEAMDDMEEEGRDWDAQAIPLLNATTFGAIQLAIGRRQVGMPFHAEVAFMDGLEVPCRTSEQQRWAAMYVPPAATWVLLAGEIELRALQDRSRARR